MIVEWLESHDKLAGWAQFLGAMLALAVTYFTAFTPRWRRKKQLRDAAARLLSHGYEAVESYHRTSANFLPSPLSLRQAALSMNLIADEMGRFPIYELNDQGNRSTARKLVATCGLLRALQLFFNFFADDLEDRDAAEADEEEKEAIRKLVGDQLQLIQDILSGKELERPEPPANSFNDGT